MVKASGYGTFSLPIEVYFKNMNDVCKVKFEYDLFLQLEGPPITYHRYEIVTFKNPSGDLRKNLIQCGGVSHLL